MGKHERQAYLKAIKERYRKANRAGKTRILDEFCAVCGYHRKDAVIVRSTIDLAHNLGLKVIAEGVETSGVWDLLSMLGCDSSQGYLMGRPMPADKLEAFLRESTSPPILTNALYAT